MATAVIRDNKNGSVKRAKAINYPIIKIRQYSNKAKIKQTLPFRVRFTNVMVPSYGSGNGAPIGIAIIGFNNYIL
jgi:hypothetical protein